MLPLIWVSCALTMVAPSLTAAMMPWIAYAAVRTMSGVLATRSAVRQRRASPGSDPSALNSERLFKVNRWLAVVLMAGLAAQMLITTI
jgi:hypothetical protein